jgi:hypothetical protein
MRYARVFLAAATVATAAIGCGGGQATTANIQPKPMPEGGDFDGVFQSPAYGRMEFTVEGDKAVGLYEGERHYGRIEGTINGNVMRFTWTQWNMDLQGKQRSKTGKGYFIYRIDEEKGTTKIRLVHRLKGEWGYAEAEVGNPWKAIKLSNRAKKVLKPHVEDGSATMDDDYAQSAGFGETGGAEPGGPGVEMSDPEEKKEEEAADDLDGLF